MLIGKQSSLNQPGFRIEKASGSPYGPCQLATLCKVELCDGRTSWVRDPVAGDRSHYNSRSWQTFGHGIKLITVTEAGLAEQLHGCHGLRKTGASSWQGPSHATMRGTITLRFLQNILRDIYCLNVLFVLPITTGPQLSLVIDPQAIAPKLAAFSDLGKWEPLNLLRVIYIFHNPSNPHGTPKLKTYPSLPPLYQHQILIC
jgi:hypothetical protein